MRNIDYATMQIGELVDQFLRNSLQQGEAMRRLQTRVYNSLYTRNRRLEAELKLRGQRDALAALYEHADPQVRFEAAAATLAVFPQRARQILQLIIDEAQWPAELAARNLAEAFDDGSYVPD